MQRSAWVAPPCDLQTHTPCPTLEPHLLLALGGRCYQLRNVGVYLEQRLQASQPPTFLLSQKQTRQHFQNSEDKEIKSSEDFRSCFVTSGRAKNNCSLHFKLKLASSLVPRVTPRDSIPSKTALRRPLEKKPSAPPCPES